MPTETVENYVRQMYLERELHGPKTGEPRYLGTNHLAGAMQVVPGSATAMLKNLARLGYVVYEPRKGSRLTADGERLALNLSRRHRLLELFMVEVLDYDWASVHDEAHRLEHAVSDHLTNAISSFLGNPRFDPHGDPIPTPAGEIPGVEQVPLSSLEPGSRAKISRIVNQEPHFLQFARREGLVPDALVRVLYVDEDAGVIKVALEKGRASLSVVAASHILAAGAEGFST
jgi:DtxR family Mn-dependent transcriptional regulator